MKETCLMKIQLFIITALCLITTGCATTNYYPLKNTSYFNQEFEGKKKAVILPETVSLQYFYSHTNTKQKGDEKQKLAEDYFAGSIKRGLGQRGFEVVEQIRRNEFEDDDERNDLKMEIVSEIIHEYNSAFGSIRQNISKEKGEGFDYSVGVRVQEISNELGVEPDVYVLPVISGYVMNLAVLDSSISAFLSGTAQDSMAIDVIIIDAKTGDIIWMNSMGWYGRSLLKDKDIRTSVYSVLENFRWQTSKESI